MKRLTVFLLMALAGWLQAASPVEFTVGSFTFDRPTDWGWIVPTSAMRKAQLSVGENPGAAEVTFFYFGPGQGGGVDANVKRWLGQFQNAESDTKSEMVGPTRVTFVQAVGEFSSGMPGGPLTQMPGYALRGAILESEQGDVFVKMTGPDLVVQGAAAAFEKMVRDAANPAVSD